MLFFWCQISKKKALNLDPYICAFHLNVPGRRATCARHLSMAWGGTAQAEDGSSVVFLVEATLVSSSQFFFHWDGWNIFMESSSRKWTFRYSNSHIWKENHLAKPSVFVSMLNFRGVLYPPKKLIKRFGTLGMIIWPDFPALKQHFEMKNVDLCLADMVK